MEKLRNTIMAIWLMAAGGVAVQAASPADTISAERAFIEMPMKNLDILTQSMRMDMVDYYHVDSIYQVRNAMEGLSHLDTVSPDYLKVEITPVSSMEFKVTPSGNRDIVMCIYTIGDEVQAHDSELTFFDSAMRELPVSKYIKMPRLSDFFNCPDKAAREKVAELVPFPTIEFEATPGADTLKAHLTVGQFMTREDYDAIKTWQLPELTYRWNGRKYVLQKDSKSGKINHLDETLAQLTE